jgi:ADP-L-glycero-D-manno-heptose 6-epimerase
MKILITGYRGFIGQNMVNSLQDHDLRFFEWGESIPRVSGLDWVVHLGAISATTERDVEKVMRQNYDFSCWLLQECQLHGVNFQYSSSASVYGTNQEFSEDSPTNPQSPYAWSKYLFDRYSKNYYSESIVQGFRYFNVHGPYEEHKGNQSSPHHKFEQQARNTGVIKLFENSYRDVNIGFANEIDTICKEYSINSKTDIQFYQYWNYLQIMTVCNPG